MNDSWSLSKAFFSMLDRLGNWTLCQNKKKFTFSRNSRDIVHLRMGDRKILLFTFTFKSRDRKRIVIWKLCSENKCDLKTGDQKNISCPNSEIPRVVLSSVRKPHHHTGSHHNVSASILLHNNFYDQTLFMTKLIYLWPTFFQIKNSKTNLLRKLEISSWTLMHLDVFVDYNYSTVGGWGRYFPELGWWKL